MLAQVYLVNSGCIESAHRAEDGRLLPVRRYEQGHVFGASGLFSAGVGDDTRRDAAHALEPTVLRCVSHSELRELMRTDPLLLQGLMRASSLQHGDAKAEVLQRARPVDSRHWPPLAAPGRPWPPLAAPGRPCTGCRRKPRPAAWRRPQ